MDRYLAFAVGTVSPVPALAKQIVGVFGGPVIWHQVGEFSFALESLSGVNSIEITTTEHLLRFDMILHELHSTSDLLPIKFGTIVLISELTNNLTKQSDGLHASLDHTAGCCELSARWLIEFGANNSSFNQEKCTPIAGQNGGIDYLTRRKASLIREKRLQTIAEQLVYTVSETIGTEIRDSVPVFRSSVNAVRRNKSESACSQATAGLVGFNLLVLRAHAEKVKRRLYKILFEDSRPIAVDGPMPAFSFTTGDWT